MPKPTLTTQQFIEKSNRVHNGFYSYENSVYVRNDKELTITCPVHGDFSQKAINHLSGNGCSKCGRGKTTSSVQSAKVLPLSEVRDKLLRFPLLSFPSLSREYVTSISKLTVICSEHGEFTDTFRRLNSSAHGCVKCSLKERVKKRKGGIDQIELRLLQDCDFKYSFPYLKTEYVSNKSKITAVCKLHGEFSTLGNTIATGSGCPLCKSDLASERMSLSFEEVIENSKKKYGPEKFEYLGIDSASVRSYRKKVHLKCLSCSAEFSQAIKDHLGGCVVGCPICAKSSSSLEVKVSEYLSSIKIEFKQRVRSLVRGYEADIFIPEKNLVIEINGLYWHSSANLAKNYHRDKRKSFENAGYRLVFLWEDEIVLNWVKVENYLNSLLGFNQKSVFARKCKVLEIPYLAGKKFLDDYHLMGSGVPSETYLGIFHAEELVGVSSYRRNLRTKKEYELYRSCYLPNTRVVGGLSKMVNFFVSGKKANLHCYADLDKFTGTSYLKAGFNAMHESLRLTYVKGSTRYGRHHFKKSDLPFKDKYPKNFSAREMLEAENIFEVYESGTLYLYRPYK